MKFLVDRMLSPELARLLEPRYPGTIHVDERLGAAAKDQRIWEYAWRHGFTILTKDKDFALMSARLGHPPKVIRIGIGNSGTREVLELMEAQAGPIEEFIDQRETGLLEIR